ncbi:MAG: hypothetical protein ABFD79_10410 [Phycisphaerales bacterium]
MNKIIAFVMLLSVCVFLVVLYIVSVILHKIPVHLAIIVGSIFAVTDISFALFFLFYGKTNLSQTQLPPITPDAPASMHYTDKLVAIDDEGITLKKYYHPFCNSKRVKYSDIKTIKALPGGCARLWGSGDFQTWFGLDWGRMKRKMTFIIEIKNSWFRSGFTCKDSDTVYKILKAKNLL